MTEAEIRARVLQEVALLLGKSSQEWAAVNTLAGATVSITLRTVAEALLVASKDEAAPLVLPGVRN